MSTSRRITSACSAFFVMLALMLAALVGCRSAEPMLPFVEPGSDVATGSPSATGSAEPTLPPPPLVFAIIGDYGTGDSHASAVASLVASWNPEFIITTGDDYYRTAGGIGLRRYEKSTGKLYGSWLPGGGLGYRAAPSSTTTTNDFYPTPGNHDYSDTGSGRLRTYLQYFVLPGDGTRSSSGSERYYDFVRGPVHFFAVNSNRDEPSGTSSTSKQGVWLRRSMSASKVPWQVVYDHHPPFSSDSKHGSSRYMRWPFSTWGADAVISGHSHTYERLRRSGIVYFVNGLGGATRYRFGTPNAGSRFRFQKRWGAQRVSATPNDIVFEFYDTTGTLVDRYRLAK